MRKVLSFVLVLSMLCSLCATAFAAEININSTQSSNTVVQYGVSESYIVTVPDATPMDTDGLGSITIGITNALLASGKSLTVYLTGDSYESGYWHLSDVNNIANKLAYSIKQGNSALGNNADVLTVNAGEAWNRTVSATLNLALTNAATQAGSYTDMLTFVVEYGNEISDDELTMNEYGFYFGQPYAVSTTLNEVPMDIEIVLYPDGYATAWVNDAMGAYYPEGTFEYSQNSIVTDLGMEISLENNGKTLVVTDNAEITLSLALKPVKPADPTSGIYVADPYNTLQLSYNAHMNYANDGSLTLWMNDSLYGEFGPNDLEFHEGYTTYNGQVTGLIYPDGSKVALVEDGEALVFVKVNTNAELNTTYNMYYDRLYAATFDNQSAGIVLRKNGTLELYVKLDNNTPEFAEMYSNTGVDYSSYYLAEVFDDVTEHNLIAQTTPYAVQIDDDILKLTPYDVHSIYWGQKYTTSIGLDDVSISLEAIFEQTSMTANGSMQSDEETTDVSVTYADGVYTINSTVNDSPLTERYDAVAVVLDRAITIKDASTDTALITVIASVDGKFVAWIHEDTIVPLALQDHNWTQEIITQGSCIEDGEVKYTCTDCGTTYVETIPAPGHIDTNFDTYCDACNTKLTEEYVEFTITPENRHLIGYTDNTSRLNIPATFEHEGVWYKVTELGNAAFNQTNLTAIHIPATVEVIGDGAFAACQSLQAVTFANNNQLQTIGEMAFSDVPSLSTINFGNCTKLQTIGKWCFLWNTTEKTLIMPSQARIDEDALYLSGITNVILTGSDDMTEFVNGVLYTNHRQEAVWYNRTNTATAITLEDTTTVIHSGAFSENKYIQSVTLPDGLKDMGDEAFFGCTGLTSIEIPGTVETWHSTFFGCTNLSKIKINEGVTNIGQSCFAGNKATSVGVLGSGADIELPVSLEIIYSGAFGASGVDYSQLTVIDLSHNINLTTLGKTALDTHVNAVFDDAKYLTTVKLPASLRLISSEEFTYFEGDGGNTVHPENLCIYFENAKALCDIAVHTANNHNYTSITQNSKIYIADVLTTDFVVPADATHISMDLLHGFTSVTFANPTGWTYGYNNAEVPAELFSDGTAMANWLRGKHLDLKRA